MGPLPLYKSIRASLKKILDEPIDNQQLATSNGQALATAGAATIDDVATVGGSHTGQKAVNLVVLTLFRLISAFRHMYAN